jgi:histidinol-phosphate aminotransferase
VSQGNEGIEKFVRPELACFMGYSACKSPDAFKGRVVKLDANENNYGASPRVQKALAAFQGYHIYPDAAQCEIRSALADYTGAGIEHIVAGSGSDQLIDILIRLFCSPGDEIINLPPTFAMFKFYADLQGARVVNVPRDADYGIDVPGIKKVVSARTKLIFIANPNNPTGTITPEKLILEVLELGLPTVVDEAYYEFTGKTFVSKVGKLPNLMVLRTFSKWAGLAGLRVGYGLFPERVASMMHAVRDPYNVNAAALVAARESLKDTAYLQANVKLIVSERERLFGELKKLAWLKPYPSEANFILCRVFKGEAKVFQAALERKGILTRFFNSPGLENCLRFSVGKPEEDDILLKALNEIG